MTSSEQDFRIGYDTSADTAAEIARLCSRCFPWGMRWVRWSGHGRRWWSRALSANGTECITFRDSGTGMVCGFCLLVFDEPRFREAIAGARASLLDKAVRAPYAPLARHFKHRMRRITSQHPVAIETRRPEREKPRSWVEIIGVDPTWRGRGLGKKLLMEAQAMSIAKGVRSIEALTGSWNAAAMKLFGNAGYTLSAGSGEDVLCSKPLVDHESETA